jgi:CrcB protein
VSAWVWVGVALLGGVGASARFLLDTLIARHLSGGFPFGTLAINASGALLLGLLTGLAVGGDLLVLAGTATLGSYTTFSTWMFESHRLAEDTETPSALVNILLSLTIGVAGAALGHTIGVHA